MFSLLGGGLGVFNMTCIEKIEFPVELLAIERLSAVVKPFTDVFVRSS